MEVAGLCLSLFDPIVAEWFARRFECATEPQIQGWREIASGRDVLISAPTGSGKTLAAFLVCIDQLVREARAGTLSNEIHAVYVSPLKALSNDVHRNLETPLAEIGSADSDSYSRSHRRHTCLGAAADDQACRRTSW